MRIILHGRGTHKLVRTALRALQRWLLQQIEQLKTRRGSKMEMNRQRMSLRASLFCPSHPRPVPASAPLQAAKMAWTLPRASYHAKDAPRRCTRAWAWVTRRPCGAPAIAVLPALKDHIPLLKCTVNNWRAPCSQPTSLSVDDAGWLKPRPACRPVMERYSVTVVRSHALLARGALVAPQTKADIDRRPGAQRPCTQPPTYRELPPDATRPGSAFYEFATPGDSTPELVAADSY